jgi:hypothetical protein
MKQFYAACSVMLLMGLVNYSQAQVASFDFNEGSGSTVTSSDGVLTGTLDGFGAPIGAKSSTDSPSGLPGDSSILFNGTEGMLADDTTDGMHPLITGPITVEAWVKPDAFSETWVDIFRYGSTIKMGWNNGNLIFTFLGVVDIFPDVEIPVPVGEWSHIAATWEPGLGVVFYFNGEEITIIGEDRAPNDIVAPNLTIGWSGSASIFEGSIDRFRIHNAIVDVADLDSDPASPKAAFATTLVNFQFNSGIPASSEGTVELTAVSPSAGIDVFGAVVAQESASGLSGDNSIKFNGTEGLIADPGDNFFLDDLLFEPHTVEAWVKVDTFSETWVDIFRYASSVKMGFNNGNLIYTYLGIIDIFPDVDIPVTPGEWHHIAVACDLGIGVYFYFDGVETAFYPLDSAPREPDEASDLTIGWSGSGSIFEGEIDRFRMHTSILSPDELDAVATEPKPAYDNTLVFFTMDSIPAQNLGTDALEAVSPSQTTGPISQFVLDSPTGGADDFSLFFNGSGSNVMIDDPDGILQMDATPLTIQAYLKFSELPQERSMILSYGLPGGYSYSVTDRNLFATTYGIKDFSEATNSIVPDDNQWHHTAMVYDVDAGEVRFYVDGALTDTVAYTSGINPTDFQRMFLGVEKNGDAAAGGNAYEGYMDRVSIYNEVIAPEDFDIVSETPINNWMVH